MEQLLLHLFGDFVVQDSYTGLHKKDKNLKGFILCLIHCIVYSLPFFLLTNWIGVIGIALTHFIIDRWNLVVYFLAIRDRTIKGVSHKRYGIFGYFRTFVYDTSNFGFKENRPFAISVWLFIITDNTLHLACNYIFIHYF